MDQRHWYLRAALQFRWSKAELLRQISDSAHEQTDFVVSTGTGNIDCDEPEQERQGNEDSSCKSQHNLQETNGRVCNEKSGGKVCDGEVVLHFRSCYQSGSNRQSGLSAGPPKVGGTWKLLRRPGSLSDDELQSCRLQFADRHGPGQCPLYASHFLRRPSGKDPSFGEYAGRPVREVAIHGYTGDY